MAGNQYKADPRQSLFLQYYLDIKSTTFSNALQSALKAGYEQEYAENITGQMPEWLSENLGKNKRLERAEKKIDEILDYNAQTENGLDNTLLKTQADVSKFIASTIGKDKGYSTRQEHTGADGKDLIPSPMLGGQTKDAVPTNDSNQEAS